MVVFEDGSMRRNFQATQLWFGDVFTRSYYLSALA